MTRSRSGPASTLGRAPGRGRSRKRLPRRLLPSCRRRVACCICSSTCWEISFDLAVANSKLPPLPSSLQAFCFRDRGLLRNSWLCSSSFWPRRWISELLLKLRASRGSLFSSGSQTSLDQVSGLLQKHVGASSTSACLDLCHAAALALEGSSVVLRSRAVEKGCRLGTDSPLQSKLSLN